MHCVYLKHKINQKQLVCCVQRSFARFYNYENNCVFLSFRDREQIIPKSLRVEFDLLSVIHFVEVLELLNMGVLSGSFSSQGQHRRKVTASHPSSPGQLSYFLLIRNRRVHVTGFSFSPSIENLLCAALFLLRSFHGELRTRSAANQLSLVLPVALKMMEKRCVPSLYNAILACKRR